MTSQGTYFDGTFPPRSQGSGSKPVTDTSTSSLSTGGCAHMPICAGLTRWLLGFTHSEVWWTLQGPGATTEVPPNPDGTQDDSMSIDWLKPVVVPEDTILAQPKKQGRLKKVQSSPIPTQQNREHPMPEHQSHNPATTAGQGPIQVHIHRGGM